MKLKQIFLVIIPFLILSCNSNRPIGNKEESGIDTVITNLNAGGQNVSMRVFVGTEHNHPIMAVWVEDLEGNYLQTLYVAQSIATGIFRHAIEKNGSWIPGEQRRPAALPRWGHQRGIQANDGYFLPEPSNPVADAYTGATPSRSFILKSKLDKPINQALNVFLEINQSWDWNEHWTNTLYPDDAEYKTSSQPAVIYRVELDPSSPGEWKMMRVIGRSHHSGGDGEIYSDIEKLTTALEIVRSAEARIE